jgi:O-antigen ligase
VFLLFLSLVWAGRSQSRARLGAWILAAALLAGIAWSQSRGTYLALGVTAAGAVVWHAMPSGWRRPAVGFIGALLVLAAVAAWTQIELRWKPGRLLEQVTTEMMRKDFYGLRNLYSRLLYWDRALSIMSAHPVTGSGVGSYFRTAPAFDTR